MSHNVTEMIALKYLETPRHTAERTAYRMHRAGAENMIADAKSRGWHSWRVVVEDVATGVEVAEIEPESPDCEVYPTELTPEGEQTVIPGCERNASERAKQLDLF